MDKINSLAASRFLQALSLPNKLRKLSTCNDDYCGDIAPEMAITQPQYNSLLLALDELEDLHICTAFREPIPARVLAAPTWVDLIINFRKNSTPHASKSSTRLMSPVVI
jgi:hypothetical protein